MNNDFIEHWGVWPVQALDGIGAGLQNVAVAGLSRACWPELVASMWDRARL